MKKHLIIALSVFLIIVSITGVTYTWFTYVHRKSLAQFVSNEIDVIAEINETIVIDEFLMDNLSFIDYEKDLIQDQTGTLHHMSSTIEVVIRIPNGSPLSKHKIQFENLSDASLIYLIVYDGKNFEEPYTFSKNYHERISLIVDGLVTKEDQLNAINNYNQQVLDDLYQVITKSDDVLFLQIAIWGDYDAVIDQTNYLNQVYSFRLVIDTVSSKGEVS
ncbi:MAG: hypothetical protein NUK62_01050 [Tenericutes bacterium]|nr:hypothetical protein [Mycoplasmatota bacterium]